MNNEELDIQIARKFDCGDGVPVLSLDHGDGADNRRPGRVRGQAPEPREARISARTFALAATVVGQLIVGLAIVLSGNLVIGAVAAVAISGCGLALVAADASRDHLDRL